MEFPTISIHESLVHPTSMFLRNLVAMDTEEMLRAQPIEVRHRHGVGADEDGRPGRERLADVQRDLVAEEREVAPGVGAAAFAAAEHAAEEGAGLAEIADVQGQVEDAGRRGRMTLAGTGSTGQRPHVSTRRCDCVDESAGRRWPARWPSSAKSQARALA